MKILDPEFDWFENCPLCQGRDLRVWEVAALAYSVHNVRVRCCQCGLVFSNPQASVQRLNYFYDKVYFHTSEYKGDYFSAESERVQRLKASEELLLLESLGAKGKILDVGCAAGYFMAEARQRGWHAEGSELSSQAAAAARKKRFKVHVGAAENLKFKGAYDVVHAAHTLEHVKDPKAFLSTLKKFLKPGGRVMIEVPNLYQLWEVVWHWKAKLRGRTAPLQYAKEHTFDFSMTTLLAFFDQAGLNPEKARIYEDSQGLLRLSAKPGDGFAKRLLRPMWVAFVKTAGFEEYVGNYIQVIAKAK